MSNKNSAHKQSPKELTTEQTRRDFLNTFGKLAVVTPVALTLLMSPSTSAAPKSCRGQGKKRCP
jgi:hypothetical protein